MVWLGPRVMIIVKYGNLAVLGHRQCVLCNVGLRREDYDKSLSVFFFFFFKHKTGQTLLCDTPTTSMVEMIISGNK